MSTAGGIELFEQAVLPDRRDRRIAYAFMVVASTGVFVYGLLSEPSVLLVAVPVGTLSVVLLIGKLLPSRVLSILDDPASIVWYYRSPQHSLTVMIADDRGRVAGVAMTAVARVEQAMETLARLAPHARAGYSEDARRAYQRNPRSVLLTEPGNQETGQSR